MNLEKSSAFPLTFTLALLYIGASVTLLSGIASNVAMVLGIFDVIKLSMESAWGGFLMMVMSYGASASAVVGIHIIRDE